MELFYLLVEVKVFSDLLTQNKDEFCYKEILKLKSIFDKNIYVEIQRHNEPHEFQLEKKLKKFPPI